MIKRNIYKLLFHYIITMVKDITTVTLKRDTYNDLMIFKLRSNASDLDEAVKSLIAKLKKEEAKNVAKNELEEFNQEGIISTMVKEE